MNDDEIIHEAIARIKESREAGREEERKRIVAALTQYEKERAAVREFQGANLLNAFRHVILDPAAIRAHYGEG